MALHFSPMPLFFSVAVTIVATTVAVTIVATTVAALNSDGLALLSLKSSISLDPTRFLFHWSPLSATPCTWPGITCSPPPASLILSLALTNLSLVGYIPSELSLLASLRSLDLSHNNFHGQIPDLRALTQLEYIDLSDNEFTGELPVWVSGMKGLKGIVNLSKNGFSGGVPAGYGDIPARVGLDVRWNNLTGQIPVVGSLVNQGPTAFEGNPGLCGFPLILPCSPEERNIRNRGNPGGDGNGVDSGRRVSERGAVGRGFLWVSVISVCVFIAMIVGVLLLSVLVVRRKRRSSGGKTRKGKVTEGVEDEEEWQKGKFVVVDDEDGLGLELEDLLRASAYVVGKSRSGIVYKVVAGGRGSCGALVNAVVAVRRLSEADDATWRFKDFEAEVEAVATVQHRNIVKLRAYYYARDEKLLVSDFIRNGSLYSALHGGPSNDLPPLSWAARLKIAQGAARALAHIHDCSSKKYIHGNIKSSKILLDDDLQPLISGFGLNRLVPGSSKPASLCSDSHSSSNSFFMGSSKVILAPSNAYLAPEARNGNIKLAQKCDVYSFGIVLMEMLTGRLPDAGHENNVKSLESLVRKVFQEERPLSEIIDPALLHEVHAKKQVLATFHVALGCTEMDPELRPKMKVVSENLDRIKFE